MSVLNKDGTSVYDHLNKTDPVAVVLALDALAERLESRNYGTVRFLAAQLRVRERLHAERVAKYRVNSKTQDIADSVERRGVALALALAIRQLFGAGE